MPLFDRIEGALTSLNEWTDDLADRVHTFADRVDAVGDAATGSAEDFYASSVDTRRNISESLGFGISQNQLLVGVALALAVGYFVAKR